MPVFLMITVEEAISRIAHAVRPRPVTRVPLLQAAHYFAAENLTSPLDLPLFDNSAMDGYAVRAENLQDASPESKIALCLRGRVAAGDEASRDLGPGECIRLFTGSKMPPGADAVVMQEDAIVNGDIISFTEPVKPLENVRLTGEDVRRGTVLVQTGQKLTAARIGLLAATGVGDVSVFRAARMRVLATGNELKEPGETLKPGEIYESNRALLLPLLAELGAETRALPIVRDTLENTIDALEAAFSEADVVISTGGVSVGELDFVKEAFTKMGGSIDLWRVAMRPGKPFVFGRLGEKLLFGLPGNPVSAFVTFLLFVRPAILKLQGAANLNLPRLSGELAEKVANRGDRRHFARVRWENGQVRLAGPQKSHMMASLAQANGLLDIPAETEFQSGRPVEVLIWEIPSS